MGIKGGPPKAGPGDHHGQRTLTLWRGLRSLHPAIFILASIIVVTILSPWLAPFDPAEQSLSQRLRPPAGLPGGEPTHLLGTDTLGRDILSRTLFGGRVALSVSLAAVVLAGTLGVGMGLVAGYHANGFDALLSRLADMQQAVPYLILAIAIASRLGPGWLNVVLILGITGWATYFRVIRGEVLVLRQREFVLAARVSGAGAGRILWRHIFPNVLPTVIVISTLLAGNVILYEASLSFLGLGLPPSIPTWGGMVAAGREYITDAWWVSFFPGLALAVTLLAINLCGDWLRDRLDPLQK